MLIENPKFLYETAKNLNLSRQHWTWLSIFFLVYLEPAQPALEAVGAVGGEGVEAELHLEVHVGQALRPRHQCLKREEVQLEQKSNGWDFHRQSFDV